jgi:hypothetical protein
VGSGGAYPGPGAEPSSGCATLGCDFRRAPQQEGHGHRLLRASCSDLDLRNGAGAILTVDG